MLEFNGKIPDHTDWQSITARSAPPPESLSEASRQIGNDLRSLANHAEGAGSEVQRFLTEQVREQPYAVLMAAAGVGYLLGGGLRSRMTPLLFGVASKLVMAMATGSSVKQHTRSDHEHR